MDKITIERETLADLIAQHLRDTYHCTRVWSAWQVGTMGEDDFCPVDESDTPGEIADAVLAALAAQPAGPVARDAALNTLAQVFHNGEEAEGDDGAVMMVDLALWNEGCEALESLVSEDELAAPPTPVPPEPIAEMDTVAIKYAHKMALDLECILAEYGGSWYNTAMQTLGEYRSEMNAIHERESPTFMGEPVIAAAGDKP